MTHIPLELQSSRNLAVHRPTTTTPAATGARRVDIQGLRAVAVLMVVAFHAGLPVPGGFVGVDVFFVISGFVITAMLMREWQMHGRIRLGRFYVRRFKRLTPALALTVAVTMLISVFVLSPLGTQQDTTRTAIGAMLLGANVVIAKITGGYFDLKAESNALLNTWSLSVEEQFYLIFPVLLLISWTLARRSRRPQAAAIALVSALGIMSFALAMLGAAGYVPPREAWLLGFYSPATRAWEFAAGALLALAGRRAVLRSRTVATGFGAAGFVMLGLSLVLLDGSTPFPGPTTLLPVLGSILLLVAGSRSSGITDRVLSVPPMVRIGDWSYSLYLWHWPLIVFATLLWPHAFWAAPAAAIVSFLPAMASYYWVEMPLRTRATPGPRQLTSLAAAVALPPMVLAVSLWQASEHGFWNPRVQDFQKAVFAYPDASCSRFVALTNANDGDCTWNAGAEGRPIYLFGDSNAGHFADAIVGAGRTLDRPVLITTTNACPFVDVQLDRLDKPTGWDNACRDFVQGTLDHLRSDAEPGTVIISNIDTYWDDGGYAVGNAPSALSTEAGAKTAALADGLATMTESLRAAGHKVVVVQTIPRWSGSDTWETSACNVARLLEDGCEQSMPVSHALERQGSVRTAVASATQRAGATVYDPWPSLCPDGICATNSPQGYPRYYRDGAHVSVQQGKDLTSDFVEALGGGAG